MHSTFIEHKRVPAAFRWVSLNLDRVGRSDSVACEQDQEMTETVVIEERSNCHHVTTSPPPPEQALSSHEMIVTASNRLPSSMSLAVSGRSSTRPRVLSNILGFSSIGMMGTDLPAWVLNLDPSAQWKVAVPARSLEHAHFKLHPQSVS